MKQETIFENLCYYDKHNPENAMFTEEHAEGRCFCNNCFYGITPLAEEILSQNLRTSNLVFSLEQDIFALEKEIEETIDIEKIITNRIRINQLKLTIENIKITI